MGEPALQQHCDSSGFVPGDILAEKYLLLEPLGAGGMGQVWTAQNLATGAEVALKLLLASRASCADVVARFRREAHATAQLSHRGIVRVFDLVEVPDVNGSVAMVMERLRGKTLAEHLEHNGPLTVAETLSIVVPVLAALHHVHGIGIVHRDLKPENIFLALEPDGQMVPKLLDFGISKRLRNGPRPITHDGFIVGTPSHMSPEQVRGDEVDARSDIFSVGIVLYMCLTGRNPYAASEPTMEAMMAALDENPEQPAHVPPALWRAIERAMAKRPDDRFSSASELADALVASTLPVVEPSAIAHSPTVTHLSQRIRMATRRRVARIALVAGVLAIAWGSIASGSIGWSRHAGARKDARSIRSTSAPHHIVAGVDRLAERELAAPSFEERRAPATPPMAGAGVLPKSSFAGSPRYARKSSVVLRDPGF